MKRKILLLVIVCLLAQALMLSALAVSATPNQKLALRTGPNTKYVELYTLPQNTSINAIEYENGNGVTWVLVEWRYNGETVRGYTGLKRMTVHGNIPWANHDGSYKTISESGTVLAAPSYDAAYRGWLNRGESVTLLDYENGYAFVEFHDQEKNAPSRGYVDADMLKTSSSGGNILIPQQPSGGANFGPHKPSGNTPFFQDNSSHGVSATPNQELALRTGPTTSYSWLFHLPEDTRLTAYEYEQGSGVTWVLVEFEYQGMRCRGYTGLKRMDVHGNIPWAEHLWESNVINRGANVYAAPSADAYYRGYLEAGTYVSILSYENGYAYVDYYNEKGINCRGYVPANVVR